MVLVTFLIKSGELLNRSFLSPFSIFSGFSFWMTLSYWWEVRVVVALIDFFVAVLGLELLGRKHSKLYLETLYLILLSFLLFLGEPGRFDLLFPIILIPIINVLLHQNFNNTQRDLDPEGMPHESNFFYCFPYALFRTQSQATK